MEDGKVRDPKRLKPSTILSTSPSNSRGDAPGSYICRFTLQRFEIRRTQHLIERCGGVYTKIPYFPLATQPCAINMRFSFSPTTFPTHFPWPRHPITPPFLPFDAQPPAVETYPFFLYKPIPPFLSHNRHHLVLHQLLIYLLSFFLPRRTSWVLSPTTVNLSPSA